MYLLVHFLHRYIPTAVIALLLMLYKCCTLSGKISRADRPTTSINHDIELHNLTEAKFLIN